MPLKNGRLTPLERRFAEMMARIGDAPAAAWRAGVKSPDKAGYVMLARPAVKAEIVRLAEERLFSEMLPLALDAHKQLLTDKAVPAGARVQAVKLTYDRTLGDGQDDSGGKEPSEMTVAEIQASIAQLQGELGERPARAKDVTPVPAPIVDDDPDEGGVFG